MTVFGWENSIIEIARGWPANGVIFEFFKFWTDYRESSWALLALVIFLTFRSGIKKLISPVIWTIFSVILGDLLSRRVVKALIMRPRPNFMDMSCAASKCWGFVSSHSTNVTAAAAFLCLYDRRNILWAAPSVLFVSLSRIYLIDHFPLDVLGGNLLGAIIGILTWYLFRLYSRKKDEFQFIGKGEIK